MVRRKGDFRKEREGVERLVVSILLAVAPLTGVGVVVVDLGGDGARGRGILCCVLADEVVEEEARGGGGGGDLCNAERVGDDGTGRRNRVYTEVFRTTPVGRDVAGGECGMVVVAMPGPRGNEDVEVEEERRWREGASLVASHTLFPFSSSGPVDSW